MNIVITGGRDYVMTEADYQFLENAVGRLRVALITTGGARGVDLQAEAWAERRGIPVRRIEPNWAREGRAAGFRRNTSLAQVADAVIAFPGGNGTSDMVAKARLRNLPVHESPSRRLARLSAIQSVHAVRPGPRMSP